MSKPALTFTVLFSLCLSSAVFAECNIPDDPQIPSGSDASGADMLKAKKAIEGYVQDAENYMSCGITSALQERMSVRLNKVVDKFNHELKVYKAKG